MDRLYDLREMLCDELKEYGAHDSLDMEALEMVDKLAHALKNIDRVIEDSEGGYSEYSGYNSYNGREGRAGNGTYRGGSYARGRGRNARRDSMGRYASSGRYYRNEGYSRAEEDMDSMVSELREMMQDLPPEKQTEVQKFIGKMESMN